MFLIFTRADGAAGASGQFDLNSAWVNQANANQRFDELVAQLGEGNVALKQI